ncbi:MAG: serine/threonine-protein kinase [Polyangiales bacterium]
MSEVETDANSEVADTLPVGAQFSKYTIVRLIGVGGMGAVYEATHTELKKRVALKTLHPMFAKNPEIRARFLREGELASRIHHPNVVDVTDFGTQDDVSFLVMEYLEGMSLEERIEKEGRLDPSVAADVMLGACAGIAAAHEEGVIHRDLKPANIFLLRQRGGDYRVKIVDFGISKATEKSMEGNLTSTGHVVGTPYYMAPEQMRSSKEVDARADQYSLGVTLYEALCGKKPFEADSLFEVVRKVAQGDYALPRDLYSDIPEGLEAIVLKMMAVDTASRFETLRDCGRALMPFATERGRVLFSTEFGDGPAPEVIAPPRPDATAGLRALSADKATVVAKGPRATTDSSIAAVTGTGQIFEVSKVPEAPAKKAPSKVVPLVGVGVIAAVSLAFWAGKQPDSANHATDTRRAISQPATTPTPVPDYAVSITATPSDAWIVVDNQFTVPGEFSRSFARDGQPHRVTVRASGYLTQTFEFTGPIARRITLDRDPAAASAPILGNAADASVALNTATIAGRVNGRPNGNGRPNANTRPNGSTATSTGAATTTNTTTTSQQHGTNNALILN